MLATSEKVCKLRRIVEHRHQPITNCTTTPLMSVFTRHKCYKFKLSLHVQTSFTARVKNFSSHMRFFPPCGNHVLMMCE